MNVIIIGGTFGIGFELAKKYLGRSKNLIILGRSEDKFQEITENLSNSTTNIITKKIDVTNLNETQTVLQNIIDQLGQLDLVVYSSGFYKPNNTFDLDIELYRKTLEVNFMGLIHVMSKVLPKMKEQGSGHVAMISSLAGFFGLPNSFKSGRC